MHRIDKSLKELIQTGKKQGYLTYSQVNAYLPDEAANPAKLDNLLMCLEEMDMDIVVGETPLSSPTGKKRARRGRQPTSDQESRRIDDPVRMYLTQMGEIPLLTREQEIALAKKIEVTRKRFRRQFLESDYAMKVSLEILTKVHTSQLPFDRTIKVSVTEGLEKIQILGRMPHNLKTLEFLRNQNNIDFERMTALETSEPRRKKLEATITVRRRKMVTLIEELSLRTQRLQPTLKRLEQISFRMTELEEQIRSLKRLKSAKDERANLKHELHDLMLMTQETPQSLRKRFEEVLGSLLTSQDMDFYEMLRANCSGYFSLKTRKESKKSPADSSPRFHGFSRLRAAVLSRCATVTLG
ncbi:MAG: hypothetical protein IID46_06180 [Planctomycetes bacterium]|nr:hypothetical protein [Planctomycetota bacterium]